MLVNSSSACLPPASLRSAVRPPCCAFAGPGYRPQIVTSFYAPYLLVPLCLAVHMAVTPQPFGSSRGGKSKRH